MAKNSIPLLKNLKQAGLDGELDFLRESVKRVAQEFVECEVRELIGVGLVERSYGRSTYRNGY